MKKNCWLILGAMLASGAIAQDNTNTNALPEMPAPVTAPAAAETTPAPAPAAKPRHRAAIHHAAPRRLIPLHEPTVTLVPGPAEVTVSNLNVRGQAGFRGVVIAHVHEGDTVMVRDQINVAKHRVDEPAQWAKIDYPAGAHVWVFGRYINSETKEVTARRLNLRCGPGENYGVVGLLDQGTPVNEIKTQGHWMEIEPPTNAYAFVAAMYLKQEAPPPEVATTTPPVTETTPTPTVTETAPTPTPAPETTPTPPPTPTPVPKTPPLVIKPTNPPPPAEVATTPPPPPVPGATEGEPSAQPRKAMREGVVRHVGSLIAPTAYELYDLRTDKNIDFLYAPPTSNLQFSRYVGMRIIATGEEGVAKRWPNTPVLSVERIQVIDTNAVPKRIFRSPRLSQPY